MNRLTKEREAEILEWIKYEGGQRMGSYTISLFRELFFELDTLRKENEELNTELSDAWRTSKWGNKV